MARMYPGTLPEHVLKNPKLSSEIKVYNTIRDKVPADYRCYYSRSWHEADGYGGEFDGEADFIVSHRENGLLFLEVKGGRVSCRESDNQWLTTDRDDFTFKITSPVTQAMKSKHHFLRRLKERLGSRYIRARHGVILPGSTRPSRALAPDAPHEIVAFGNDMAKLDQWIISRMSGVSDDREMPLGLDGEQALEEILAGHFELQAHIGCSLADDAKEIERLTSEQAWILDSLDHNRQLAITGGAGSGKTVLAIEAAVRSAEGGRRTLLTCFNVPLANHLRELCSSHPNLVVAGFHSLCGTLSEKAGLPLPKKQDEDFYRDVLPNALVEAVDLLPELRFDTIIVDEGQDFKDSWLDALKLTLSNLDTGRFYVFYDDNQRLFSHEASFVSALPQSVIPLSRNLRNTRRIHTVMSKWYEGKRSMPAGPEGEPVAIHECRSLEHALKTVADRIRTLLTSGQLKPSDIAVLDAAGSLDLGDNIAGARACRADAIGKNCVVVDTVRRFKGLSRPCVFVLGLEGLRDPENIYVATSRANVLLELAGSPDDIARIMCFGSEKRETAASRAV
ncbi:NERD domain-containing protein [Novosphingobium sp. CCH12-A3]|uniref:NERD domain-containing protein n=1 Tax=Novosphingobium sp. CCH12-A3 TaxID=1768752 RepID=UPI0007836D4D|nr:NERD domain-containing protein [Novosphingobium sp. CCH12-A3]